MLQKDYNHKYLNLSIDQARSASELGNYPVGAVLTIDNILVAKGENKINEKKSFLNHAEMRMFIEVSEQMYASKRKNPKCVIRLYSTLEPCIQCFGASVTNQVDEVYYIIDDPNGGATKIDNDQIGLAYKNHWPRIIKTKENKEVLDLMIEFFRNEIIRGNTEWPSKMLKLYGYS